MKIKLRANFIALFIALFIVTRMQVMAQPVGSCGTITNLSVVYATVDNLGIAPRPMPGSEQQFNCIAARDPNFQAFRTDSAWKAANYWFILLGQELGAPLQPLPVPTN